MPGREEDCDSVRERLFSQVIRLRIMSITDWADQQWWVRRGGVLLPCRSVLYTVSEALYHELVVSVSGPLYHEG